MYLEKTNFFVCLAIMGINFSSHKHKDYYGVSSAAKNIVAYSRDDDDNCYNILVKYGKDFEDCLKALNLTYTDINKRGDKYDFQVVNTLIGRLIDEICKPYYECKIKLLD